MTFLAPQEILVQDKGRYFITVALLGGPEVAKQFLFQLHCIFHYPLDFEATLLTSGLIFISPTCNFHLFGTT